MQKTKMALGVGIATLGALLSIPVLSRQWSGDELTLATIAILTHSMFGLVDIFRPIIVRRTIANRAFATLANILVPSLIFGAIAAALVWILGITFGSAAYYPLLAAASVSTLLFCSYSPFWALMDSDLRMGDAYLIRSASVGALYVIIAVGSVFDEIGFVYAGLVGVNIAAGVAFWAIGRHALVPGRFSIDRDYLRDSTYLGVQNLAKLANDFGDRLISSFLLPASFSGAYNMSSDMAGRVNVPSQIAASYYYPVICAKRQKREAFFSLGVAISFAITFACMSFYIWGFGLYEIYFGRGRESFFPVFCTLLLTFGCYSLSFFGQTLLRSMSLDRSITLSFVIPTLVGASYAVPLVADGEVTVAEVAISAMIFKSSCLLLMLRLFRDFPVKSALGIGNVVLSYGLIIIVLV